MRSVLREFFLIMMVFSFFMFAGFLHRNKNAFVDSPQQNEARLVSQSDTGQNTELSDDLIK